MYNWRFTNLHMGKKHPPILGRSYKVEDAHVCLKCDKVCLEELGWEKYKIGRAKTREAMGKNIRAPG
jgi:hypothetical protein